jgi:hypothetical protein
VIGQDDPERQRVGQRRHVGAGARPYSKGDGSGDGQAAPGHVVKQAGALQGPQTGPEAGRVLGSRAGRGGRDEGQPEAKGGCRSGNQRCAHTHDISFGETGTRTPSVTCSGAVDSVEGAHLDAASPITGCRFSRRLIVVF